MSPSSSFEVLRIVSSTRVEDRACLYASSSSPRSTAAFHFSPASSRLLRRSAFVASLSSGGFPSKTKTGFIPFSRKLTIRKRIPERWEVTLP